MWTQPEPINAELLAAYRELVERIANSTPLSIGAIGNARAPQFGVMEIERWREIIARAESHPAADLEKLRAAIQAALDWMDLKGYGGDLYRTLRAALGTPTKPTPEDDYDRSDDTR